MNKEETLALYKKGCKAWNAWAEEMLAQRDKLTEIGEWINLKGEKRERTRDWCSAAEADFRGHTFEGDVDFSHFMFPGVTRFDGVTFNKANFDEATFYSDVWFEDARFTGVDFRRAAFKGATRFHRNVFEGVTSFEAATFDGQAWFGQAKLSVGIFTEISFHGDVWFGNATFTHPASFGNTTFAKGANFYASTFNRDALFWGARFGGNAMFSNATFNDMVDFGSLTFVGSASFNEATFNDQANFAGVTFCDNVEFKGTSFSDEVLFDEVTFSENVDFSQAVFGYTSFRGALFKANSNFAAMHGQSSFTLKDATFFSVPDFGQAHFAEAPRLDNLQFHALPLQSKRLWMSRPASVKQDVAARWRALKRIAIEAHDHERELDFLAEEIKSLRGVQDWLLPNPLSLRKGEPICWPGGGRYWAGLFYQWFSDFGRSIFRPFLWWMIITGLFALFYFNYSSALNLSNSSKPTLAIGVPICDPPIDALYLSIHNGLVVSGLGRSEKLAQSYACLYGNSGKNQLTLIMPNMVVLVGIGQTIISAVLIFLFLLALRNYFRIK